MVYKLHRWYYEIEAYLFMQGCLHTVTVKHAVRIIYTIGLRSNYLDILFHRIDAVWLYNLSAT